MPAYWFDAHLDLAYLAVNGRDMLAPLDRAAGPHPPAAVTLPSLGAAGVRFALATIFTEANGHGPEGYPAGDAEAAHQAGRAQLEVYVTWRDRGAITLDGLGVLRADENVGEVRAGPGAARTATAPIEARVRRWDRQGRARANAARGRAPVGAPCGAGSRPPSRRLRPLHAGVLVECADPIRSPEELGWWVERGVVAIGLTWARGSRYASGNSEPSCDSPVGISAAGREMIRRMDDLGLVHDASHLSDRALRDLFSLTNRPVIASHSNCRALLDTGGGAGGNQRHLTDDAIREIGRRGGVVGLNLVRNFIRPGLNREDPTDRPSIDDALRHVERAADIMGHRRGVGLGSDLDGGISAHDLPAGIESAADFRKLSDRLSALGWTDEDVEGFAWRNWARFFARAS